MTHCMHPCDSDQRAIDGPRPGLARAVFRPPRFTKEETGAGLPVACKENAVATSLPASAVLAGLDDLRDEQEEFYRALHQHPELSHPAPIPVSARSCPNTSARW